MQRKGLIGSCGPCAILFCLLLAGQTPAQEMLGIMNGHYNGALSGIINPANSNLSRNFLQVNLLGGDFYLQSNYFFVNKEDYSFSGLFSLNTEDEQYLHVYSYPEFTYVDSVYYFDYRKDLDYRYLYANARILGPGIHLHTGKHAFTLYSGFRNNVSLRNVPSNVANFIFRGQDYYPQHNLNYIEEDFNMDLLSWIDIGLGYAYRLWEHETGELNAGITMKALLGTGGMYTAVNRVSYMVPNTDSIWFYDIDATVGLSLPMNYNDNDFPVFDPLIKGWGMGFDFGVNYSWIPGELETNGSWLGNGDEAVKDYRLTVGLSLLDFGWIKFSKSVEVHQFTNPDTALWSGLRDYQAESVEHLLRSASRNILGDSLASLTTQTTFSVVLPSAISVQVDYRFYDNLYANLTYVQGLRLAETNIRRPALVALTPRYETKNFEVNLPLSIYDYRYPQIGLSFRIYNLVVGTEKLGTFLNLTDVKGIDVYFALGFSLDPKEKGIRTFRGRSPGGCDSYPDYDRYRIYNSQKRYR